MHRFGSFRAAAQRQHGLWKRRVTTTSTPAAFSLQRLLLPASSSSLAASTALSSSSSSCQQHHAFSTSTSSPSSPPIIDNIHKVLIANRGEIACRIIRTCRRLGLETVAVYSNADGPAARHAAAADECYQIGTGPTPAESYLLQDELLEIAARSGADAIHPGYGFLSENAGFVQAIEQQQQANAANVAFVGPGAAAIRAMGSKSESKAIMEAAGVPTTPGFYETTAGDADADSTTTTNSSTDPAAAPQDAELLRHHANQIGYPVLIKAVLGGGGKGMRLVWNDADFLDALAACQRESLAAFGDARVLLEKYLVRPRHVEVQIVADKHGNVVHLYERDCSLQRRHQKVIEEAPASDLPPALRERLGEMGKRAAQAVGYVNAGTVEFLLDTTSLSTTNEETPFYFCEMNTRLQVEHAISEMITGIDLVEWQLRVAAGQELPICHQAQMPAATGHAFEARIYAENPARNFLPAVGNLWHHRPPVVQRAGEDNDQHPAQAVNGIRVDTGLQAGQDISMYYDPMISKLIVHDQDRKAALAKLVRALQQYQIAGVPTNMDFLIHCAQHPVFAQAGAINTGFLDDYGDEVMQHLLPSGDADEGDVSMIPSPLAQTVGAYAVSLFLEQRMMDNKDSNEAPPAGPWSSQSGSWRMGGELGRARRTLRLMPNGQEITYLSHRDGSLDVLVHDDDNAQDESSPFHITGTLATNGEMQVVVNGVKRIQLTTVLRVHDGTIQVAMWPRNLSPDAAVEQQNSYAWEFHVEHPLLPSKRWETDAVGTSGSGSGLVKSPMPGTIRRVLLAQGEPVQAGQVVMVMEAMKMEHSIESPVSGTIGCIHFQEGDQVQADQVVMEMESSSSDTTEDEEAV